MGDLGGQHRQNRLLDIDLAQVARFHADLEGQGQLQVGVVDIAEVLHDLAKGPALLLLQLQGLVDLGAADLAHLHEDPAEGPALQLLDGRVFYVLCHSVTAPNCPAFACIVRVAQVAGQPGSARQASAGSLGLTAAAAVLPARAFSAVVGLQLLL